MPRCSGVKRDNSQCERIVGETNSYCFAHDPSRKAERSANASKAGKSRQGLAVGDIHRIKETLLRLGDDLIAGTANRGNAAVAATCFGTAIKAIEAETRLRELIESRLVETNLRVQEQNELIGRLEELEERLAMEKKTEGRQWGA